MLSCVKSKWLRSSMSIFLEEGRTDTVYFFDRNTALSFESKPVFLNLCLLQSIILAAHFVNFSYSYFPAKMSCPQSQLSSYAYICNTAHKCVRQVNTVCQWNTERERNTIPTAVKGSTDWRSGWCHRENRSMNILGETGWDAGSTFDTGHGWPRSCTTQ